MNTRFTISYHPLVAVHDVPRLSSEWSVRIQHAISQKLTIHPDIFGKPLRRTLSGYRKLRVGDYRVIFRIEGLVVRVMVIGHRRDVYEILMHRM